jgi:hypothetical protein
MARQANRSFAMSIQSTMTERDEMASFKWFGNADVRTRVAQRAYGERLPDDKSPHEWPPIQRRAVRVIHEYS